MVKLIKNTFYKESLTKKRLCDFIQKSDQLSMGEQCRKFEKKFSNWQGRKFSVLFNSGSSANLALIQSLLNLKVLKKNIRVGVSGLTWSTNIMPLQQLGLNIIPIDISIYTLNINLKTIRKHKIDVLFITNVLGLSCDFWQIKNYCDDNKILLLEDNCESLGSTYRNIKLGNFGMASTFSFYVGHQLSTIEGGMVCTDNQVLYNMLKMVRAHGWDRDLEVPKNEFYDKYKFYYPAYNLRPTEITGFIGNQQLNYIDDIIDLRHINYVRMRRKMLSNNDILNISAHNNIISNFAIPVILKTKKLFEKYLKKVNDLDIETRPILGGNITNHTFFYKYVSLPVCEKVYQNGFYLPNNPDLTETELKKIERVING